MPLFDLCYPPPTRQRLARPSGAGTSIPDFYAAFPDEAACLKHVLTVRFGTNSICPRCKRPTSWRVMRGARMVAHDACKKRFSPLTGTAMAHSRIPTQLWFYAMLHLANSVDGATASFLARHLGFHFTSAQRLLYRLRLHLAAIDEAPLASGSEAVYVRLERIRGATIALSARHNVAHILLVASAQGVQTLVIDRVRIAAMRALLQGRLGGQPEIITDCYDTARVLQGYRAGPNPPARFVPEVPESHEVAATQTSAFLRYFREGLRSRQLQVQQKYLWLYLKEYEFRFNRRHRSDETFADMVSAFPEVSQLSAARLRAQCSDFRE